jgi:serine/threonine protein kinase
MAETSFGPYDLVARLGSGGMAEVWKATSSGPGGFARAVVIKRILPHLADDQRFTTMFLSEARLSARLHHGNIVDVFACGEIDGRYYLAMEFVNGHDLHRVLRAHQALGTAPPPGFGAFVVREICRALGYAHAAVDDQGRPLAIVHRDVSPSNVMVSYDGAVKLVDFGIAKALGEVKNSQTRVTALEGKRGYLAPEAMSGLGVDARADQYAAGVVLHEMLTGERLFPLRDPRAPRPAVLPPSALNPAVPEELDRVCLRALEVDRERRYATCEELADELDQVAHKLAWGPQQVAKLLAALIPDTRPLPGSRPIMTESMSPSGASPATPPGGERTTPSTRAAMEHDALTTPARRAARARDAREQDAREQDARARDARVRDAAADHDALTTPHGLPPTTPHALTDVVAPLDAPTSQYVSPPARPRRRVAWYAFVGAFALTSLFAFVLLRRSPAPPSVKPSSASHEPSSPSRVAGEPIVTPLVAPPPPSPSPSRVVGEPVVTPLIAPSRPAPATAEPAAGDARATDDARTAGDARATATPERARPGRATAAPHAKANKRGRVNLLKGDMLDPFAK